MISDEELTQHARDYALLGIAHQAPMPGAVALLDRVRHSENSDWTGSLWGLPTRPVAIGRALEITPTKERQVKPGTLTTHAKGAQYLALGLVWCFDEPPAENPQRTCVLYAGQGDKAATYWVRPLYGPGGWFAPYRNQDRFVPVEAALMQSPHIRS
jgi:hypothetical protein